MTDLAGWQKGNEDYLAAALHWLRLRLELYLARNQAPLLLSPSAPFPPPSEPATVSEAQLAEAAAAMVAAENLDPPPALVIAAQGFHLSRFERDVLLLCAAMELDPGLASLCARIHGDANKAHPTFALALSVFDEPAWDALTPDHPLRYWRLLEINQPGAQALTVSAIRADERMVNYIKGLNYVDDRLSPLLVPLDVVSDDAGLPASQQATVDSIVGALRQTESRLQLPAIHLIGSDASSKRLVAARAAIALRLHSYRLPAALLPAQPADLETVARLWQRESILLPVALYLDAHDAEFRQTEGFIPPLNRFLVRTGGIVFLDTRDVWPGLSGTILFDVAKPTSGEQQAAWATALAPASGDNAARLAGQFNLDLGSIKKIARDVLGEGLDDTAATISERLWAACLTSTRPQVDNLAQRLDPRATLDDIVLPAAEKQLLQNIADQVGQRTRVYEDWGFGQKMNRGRGISALFAGDSGTGKTMAAEAIANKLQLDLYRIDLSAVVSKYIGETEKNLREVFNSAEDGGAILFFDEADALFGKRSEVKDSHDRYANIEVNYLLQRLESYRGLAILATNMKGALDSAFMRRLRFVVDFPYPGLVERKAIWQGVFPEQTKTAGLDFAWLARLDLTGGNIHNVALNAAFLAAQADSAVTMPLVLDAARTEFRKLGRLISERDLQWKEPIKPNEIPGAGDEAAGADGTLDSNNRPDVEVAA
jgi:SpoVK/Ycf46/Vps4 family AAA+-type ATPase